MEKYTRSALLIGTLLMTQAFAQESIDSTEADFSDPPKSPLLFIVDGSPSMRDNFDDKEPRFEALKSAVGLNMKKIPMDRPIGLAGFGITRGCEGDNYSMLKRPNVGEKNRNDIQEEFKNFKFGSSSPFTLSMQKAVYDMTGKLVPVKKTPPSRVNNKKVPRPAPDANTPMMPPGPDAPTLVFFTDAQDNCEADACQFVKDLQEQGIQIKIKVIAIGMARQYRAQARLDCMSQFPNFESKAVSSKLELTDAVDKVVAGEGLRAEVLKMSSDKGDVEIGVDGTVTKTELNGIILPRHQPKPEVEIEELKAVALPLILPLPKK